MPILHKLLLNRARWFGAVCLLASAVSVPAIAQSLELPSDIHAAEELWATVWTNGDKATYRSMLAEEFTWTFVTGQVNGKEQAVEALNAFTIPENSKTVKVYGNTAVVYGTARLNFRGRPITERFVRIWVKNADGQWQVVLFQATEIL